MLYFAEKYYERNIFLFVSSFPFSDCKLKSHAARYAWKDLRQHLAEDSAGHSQESCSQAAL